MVGASELTTMSKGRLPRNTDLPESYNTFFPPPLMLLLTPAARSTLICLPSNCSTYQGIQGFMFLSVGSDETTQLSSMPAGPSIKLGCNSHDWVPVCMHACRFTVG